MKKTKGECSMAQQAARRIKRTASGKQTALWHGLLISVLATTAAVMVFALVIGLTDVSDGVIRIVNQLIKIGAIFLGVHAIVPRGAENGVRKGAALGLIYMGMGVLIYALLSGQKLTAMGYIIDLFMGIAAGGLSGMILSSMHRK